MYHFTADHPPVLVRLSFRAIVAGQVRQYLKQFQIDAIQFMHGFLAKGEFCCYNDESGLGKQASVAVLLDAACLNRKTLIVVQNDDIYVNGWEFHFNVLTKSSVMVIKESKDSTNTHHNVYIAKWSTLRAIGDLSKFEFDFIILDNRGQMLNNSFCTSMLLKHFERKVNILISSVDITSDLKLLHNILKLGGRLEPRYTSFKSFEEKFKLPDSNDLVYKKVDLEDYFLKRERLADYCKHYRLRRYCHQFEHLLPLVATDRYKINLEVWREKQNATNSEGSSVEVTNKSRPNENIRDTQELFEEYCRQRRKLQANTKLKQQQQQEIEQQQRREQDLMEKEQKRLAAKKAEEENVLEIIDNADDEVAVIYSTSTALGPISSRENTEEALLMSPLLVVSDSEDLDDVPEICNERNDTDIVDLSSDKENDQIELSEEPLPSVDERNQNGIINGSLPSDNGNANALSSEEESYCTENANKDCTTDKNVAECQESEVRVKKKRKVYIKEAERLKADVATNLKYQNVPTPKRCTRNNEITQSVSVKKRGIALSEMSLIQRAKTNVPNKMRKSDDKRDIKNKSNGMELYKKTQSKQQEDISKGTNKKQNANNTSIKDEKEGKNLVSNVVIKIEEVEEPPATPSRRSNSKMIKLNRIKRELSIDHLPVHNRETRSMQRTTRLNASCSKYSFPLITVHSDRNKQKKKIEKEKLINKQNAQPDKSQSAKKIRDSQAPLISMTCSDDYEPIQCAQRLSDVGVSETTTQRKSAEFLVPPTPPVLIRNSLIPSSFASSNGFIPDSDIILLPPPTTSKKARGIDKGKQSNEDVILLSGSETDNSVSSVSRRTRALKPRRAQNQTVEASGNAPTFSQLLAKHNTRQSTKSPDLFSNCSDFGQLTLSQQQQQQQQQQQPPQPPAVNAEDEPNAPFEGFKIFGSEVKQLQQHYALAKDQMKNTTGKQPTRSRSCLDILENMFEPKTRKPKPSSTTTADDLGETVTVLQQKKTTQKRKKQNPIVPNHPIEAIVEAKTQQEAKLNKSSHGLPLNEDEIFEITSNGTFGSVMRLHSNGDISPVQQTQKSQKTPNKITKYFMGGGGLTQHNLSSQEDSGNNSESGTPSKKQQQTTTGTQNVNTKKSPKQKHNNTQATKLTKWFTKNSPNKQLQAQVSNEISSSAKETSKSSKRQVKRRRLDLTQVRDDPNEK